MARRAKHQEHENLERWLVSYADFITLLFAFFVVMYSISSVNEGKYRVLSDSLVAAFRSPPKTLQPIQIGKPAKSPVETKLKVRQSPLPIQLPEMPLPWLKPTETKEGGPEVHAQRGDVVDHVVAELVKNGNIDMSPAVQAALKEKLRELTGAGAGASAPKAAPADVSADQLVVMKKIAGDVQRAMQPLIDRHLIAVRKNDLWVEIEIKASVLFDSGDAEVNHAAVPVLTSLARILKPFPNVIRVEGFTDSVPIRNGVYPSNWELSAARAASVVRLLVQHGIAPPRLRAVGFGQYHPVADNSTADGRRKNRRVVMVILANNGAAESVRADLRKIPSPGADGGAPTGADETRSLPPGPAAGSPDAGGGGADTGRVAVPATPSGPADAAAAAAAVPAPAATAAPAPAARPADGRAAAAPAASPEPSPSAAPAKGGPGAGAAAHNAVATPAAPAGAVPAPKDPEAGPVIAPPIQLPSPIRLPSPAPFALPGGGTPAKLPEAAP